MGERLALPPGPPGPLGSPVRSLVGAGGWDDGGSINNHHMGRQRLDGARGDGAQGDGAPLSPLEIFVSHATGETPSASTFAGLPAAMASSRLRSRAIMIVAVLTGVAGLLWWMQSTGGAGGGLMDPDLPFAAGVEPDSNGDADGGPVSAIDSEARASPAAPGASGGGPSDSTPTASGTPGDSGQMVVHVAGAVMVPGVHVVVSGARIHDAITAAGGPRNDADLNRLNLASPLVDGSQVYVPLAGELTPPPAAGGGAGITPSGEPGNAGSSAGSGSPVSLSSSSSTELQTLPGVGPSTAEAIIAHRNANGPFASVDALLDVRGIGPAKLSAIRDLVVP